MADTSQFDINKFIQPFDIAGQKTESSDYLNRYSTAIPQIRSNVEAGLGLPQMRESYLGGLESANLIQNQIRAMPQTVAATTKDSLVTEGQRQNLVNSQISPLSRGLETVTSANESLANRLNLTEQMAEKRTADQMLPWEKEYDILTQRQAREESLYSFSSQLELDRLIANQNAGITLSEGEKNRANALALQELQYKQALEVAKINNPAETKSSLVSIGEGSAIYDPTTGKVVYKNPKTYAPSDNTGGWGTSTSGGWE